MRKRLVISGLVLATLTGVALAQGQAPAAASPSGDMVPSWVFNMVCGLFLAGLAAQSTVIKVLWNKLNAKEATGIETLTKSVDGLTTLVDRLAGSDQTEKDGLRERLTTLQTRNDKQQDKMLRLAVRVQRSVEALAQLEVPDVESDLGDGA